MKKVCYLILLTVILFSCREKESIKNHNKSEKKEIVAINYSKKEKEFYKSYEIVKLSKEVVIEETKCKNLYVVVKEKDKVLFEIDGIHSAIGNSVDFGLFRLVKGKDEQLVVSQTIPRNGRHWILDLSNQPKIIFDSYDYGLGREELYLIDIDNDSSQELVLENTVFWGFDGLSMANSPLSRIIFRYDNTLQKYVPANPVFKDYFLKDIYSDIEKLNSNTTTNYLSDRLDIFLRFVYIGQENEGWEFFDKYYLLSDSKTIKSKIKTVLLTDPIYQIFYLSKATEQTLQRTRVVGSLTLADHPRR